MFLSPRNQFLCSWNKLEFLNFFCFFWYTLWWVSTVMLLDPRNRSPMLFLSQNVHVMRHELWPRPYIIPDRGKSIIFPKWITIGVTDCSNSMLFGSKKSIANVFYPKCLWNELWPRPFIISDVEKNEIDRITINLRQLLNLLNIVGA